MNYTDYTLGDLLSAKNETIRRNATSILKILQRTQKEIVIEIQSPRRADWIEGEDN